MGKQMIKNPRNVQGIAHAGKGVLKRQCSKCGIKSENKTKGNLTGSVVHGGPDLVPPNAYEGLRFPVQPRETEIPVSIESRFVQDFSRVPIKSQTMPKPAEPTARQPVDPYEKDARELSAQVKTQQKNTPCIMCAFQLHDGSGRNRPKTLDEIGEQLSATSQSLDDETRAFMEERFGVDFSGVKIHTGQEAVLAAQVLRADAFTIGNHVFFSHGQYNPRTTAGKKLLAHELVHVIQQGNSAVGLQSPVASTQAMASLEVNADTISESVSSESTKTGAVSHSAQQVPHRIAVSGTPLGFLLRGRWRQPGQGYLDCVNNCLSNNGFAATVGGLIVGICGVIAAIVAAALTPETGGVATAPAAVFTAAFCVGGALGVPTGLMAGCLWECRD